jgi:prepilin peptidase CpaA
LTADLSSRVFGYCGQENPLKEKAMTFVGNHVALIAFFVTTVMALVAAVIDFRRFRVPNALTFPLCISGLVFHAVVNGLSGLQYSAGGIMAGVLILLLFYVLGVMGAGDVKLLAAIGAWIGGSIPCTCFVSRAW